MMQSNLEKIYAWHTKQESPVIQYLQNGISLTDAKNITDSFPLSLPSDYFKVVNWKNGTLAEEGTVLNELHFFPGFYLLSIEDSIMTYNELILSDLWKDSWFPIFSNGGGDYFAIDCNAEDNFPIIGFMINEGEHYIEYLNLKSMIETLSTCFGEGAYYYDQEGYLEIDDMLEAKIANRINPGLSRWEQELI